MSLEDINSIVDSTTDVHKLVPEFERALRVFALALESARGKVREFDKKTDGLVNRADTKVFETSLLMKEAIVALHQATKELDNVCE